MSQVRALEGVPRRPAEHLVAQARTSGAKGVIAYNYPGLTAIFANKWDLPTHRLKTKLSALGYIDQSHAFVSLQAFMNKTLDIRDVAILDSLPTYGLEKTLLNVGCGAGRIDRQLQKMGWTVYATDATPHEEWAEEKTPGLHFSEADIFDLGTMPIKSSPVVMASEVIEHLLDYKTALANMLEITETRLILTFPHRTSFNPPPSPPPIGHCNFWDDQAGDNFKDVHEFEDLCRPYSVSITKIRTKPEDVEMGQKA